FGFYESVIAAPSQQAALRAWGTSQNLFAQGLAHVVTDEETLKAALAHPGTPLQRAIGTKDPFALKPGTPKITGLDARSKERQPKKKSAPAQPTPPPPDRSKLTAAEKALAQLREDRAREERELRAKRAAIEAEEARSRQEWERRFADAQHILNRERRTY